MGYSSTNLFSKKEKALLEMARILVGWIPEIQGLRCHEVSRAVGAILGLPVQDGTYGPVDHSWLTISPKKYFQYPTILDVYAVGSLPTVRMCDGFFLLPYNREYKPGPFREDIDEGQVLELIGIMQDKLLNMEQRLAMKEFLEWSKSEPENKTDG